MCEIEESDRIAQVFGGAVRRSVFSVTETYCPDHLAVVAIDRCICREMIRTEPGHYWPKPASNRNNTLEGSTVHACVVESCKLLYPRPHPAIWAHISETHIMPHMNIRARPLIEPGRIRWVNHG